jgi:hypothetical protein
LRKAALGLACFERNSIEEKLASGDAQQEASISRLRESGLQFVPGDLELGFRPLVLETIETNVLNQNIQAMDEGACRGATACLRCARDRDMLPP